MAETAKRAMNQKLVEVRTALVRAKDEYDYKCTQAQGALKAVVGDGTGNADDLADAKAIAKEFGFALVLADPLPVGKSAKK